MYDESKYLATRSNLTVKNVKSLDCIPYEPKSHPPTYRERVDFVKSLRCYPREPKGELDISNDRIIDSESLYRNTAQLSDLPDHQPTVSDSKKKYISAPSRSQSNLERCTQERTNEEFINAVGKGTENCKAGEEEMVEIIEKKDT